MLLVFFFSPTAGVVTAELSNVHLIPWQDYGAFEHDYGTQNTGFDNAKDKFAECWTDSAPSECVNGESVLLGAERYDDGWVSVSVDLFFGKVSPMVLEACYEDRVTVSLQLRTNGPVDSRAPGWVGSEVASEADKAKANRLMVYAWDYNQPGGPNYDAIDANSNYQFDTGERGSILTSNDGRSFRTVDVRFPFSGEVELTGRSGRYVTYSSSSSDIPNDLNARIRLLNHPRSNSGGWNDLHTELQSVAAKIDVKSWSNSQTTLRDSSGIELGERGDVWHSDPLVLHPANDLPAICADVVEPLVADIWGTTTDGNIATRSFTLSPENSELSLASGEWNISLTPGIEGGGASFRTYAGIHVDVDPPRISWAIERVIWRPEAKRVYCDSANSSLRLDSLVGMECDPAYHDASAESTVYGCENGIGNIEWSNVNDGHVDCPDGSDEPSGVYVRLDEVADEHAGFASAQFSTYVRQPGETYSEWRLHETLLPSDLASEGGPQFLRLGGDVEDFIEMGCGEFKAQFLVKDNARPQNMLTSEKSHFGFDCTLPPVIPQGEQALSPYVGLPAVEVWGTTDLRLLDIRSDLRCEVLLGTTLRTAPLGLCLGEETATFGHSTEDETIALSMRLCFDDIQEEEDGGFGCNDGEPQARAVIPIDDSPPEVTFTVEGTSVLVSATSPSGVASIEETGSTGWSNGKGCHLEYTCSVRFDLVDSEQISDFNLSVQGGLGPTLQVDLPPDLMFELLANADTSVAIEAPSNLKALTWLLALLCVIAVSTLVIKRQPKHPPYLRPANTLPFPQTAPQLKPAQTDKAQLERLIKANPALSVDGIFALYKHPADTSSVSELTVRNHIAKIQLKHAPLPIPTSSAKAATPSLGKGNGLAAQGSVRPSNQPSPQQSTSLFARQSAPSSSSPNAASTGPNQLPSTTSSAFVVRDNELFKTAKNPDSAWALKNEIAMYNLLEARGFPSLYLRDFDAASAEAQRSPSSPPEVTLVLAYESSSTDMMHINRHDETVLWEVAYALIGRVHRLHASGVTHMDLKPQNVLIRQQGTSLPSFAHLIDFGTSAPVGTEPTVRGGTPGYAHPTQLDLAASIVADPLYDWFAVARILLFLFPPQSLHSATSEPARLEASIRSLIESQTDGVRLRVSSIPEAVRVNISTFVRQATALRVEKDLTLLNASVNGLLQALELSTSEESASPPSDMEDHAEGGALGMSSMPTPTMHERDAWFDQRWPEGRRREYEQAMDALGEHGVRGMALMEASVAWFEAHASQKLLKQYQRWNQAVVEPPT